MKHIYNLQFSPRDDRDHLYPLRFERLALPAWGDLRNITSEVSDQATLGACGSFGIVDGLMESLARKAGQNNEYSKLWFYQKVLMSTFDFGRDVGMNLRDGMKVASKQGVPLETYWPYDVSKFNTKPPTELDDYALQYKINTYHRLYTVSDVKHSIYEGYGCVIGFMVRKSFETITNNGIMPLPKPWEAKLGGHGVFIVGYQDNPLWSGGGYFIIKNSWGTWWGDKGFFYMPYSYLTPDNVSEIWTGR